MCTEFQLHMMENYQGDLADIVRAGGGGGTGLTATDSPAVTDTWQYPSSSSTDMMENYQADFGDPFCSIRDPILFPPIPPPPPAPAPPFFDNDLDIDLVETSTNSNSNSNNSNSLFASEMKRPNIFSRMLQISPNSSNLNSPPPLPPPSAAVGGGGGVAGNDKVIATNSASNVGLQISSPQNPGTIKRRKSQAKKVVCVPAPAPANSRPSGEVVPSDLWAWRKYGQKPIKGSPYPRGYYRCSSSKGCSARKQVERSRTDPNMLVITYTSEHNHPWPTQRNALAGSTRSQASKTATSTTTATKSQTPKPSSTRAENQTDPLVPLLVKEETTTTTLAMTEDDTSPEDHHMQQINELDEFRQPGGFPQSYKPVLPVDEGSAGQLLNPHRYHYHHHQNHEDFFAELGEIETTDPLNLMFSHGFQEKKAAIDDAFNFYNWSTTTTTITTTSHNNNNEDDDNDNNVSNNNNNVSSSLGNSNCGQSGL